MKSFARETACALAVTIGLWTPVARGQSTDQKSVPVRPGERRTAPLPPPTQGSIPLTLDRAIGLALANNEDLNVSINAAEAFRYTIVANKGIFDPLLQAALSRSHSELPASSTLIGAAVRSADATDFSASISQPSFASPRSTSTTSSRSKPKPSRPARKPAPLAENAQLTSRRAPKTGPFGAR